MFFIYKSGQWVTEICQIWLHRHSIANSAYWSKLDSKAVNVYHPVFSSILAHWGVKPKELFMSYYRLVICIVLLRVNTGIF